MSESVSHPTISSFVIPFVSCPQSFPASGAFQMREFFTSGGQSLGASAAASVLPKNTQDWSPLGWTGLISLQSKGLSRVFPSTTVWNHQFFSAQLSLCKLKIWHAGETIHVTAASLTSLARSGLPTTTTVWKILLCLSHPASWFPKLHQNSHANLYSQSQGKFQQHKSFLYYFKHPHKNLAFATDLLCIF